MSDPFKAYDVRGVVGPDFGPKEVFRIGIAFARYLKQKTGQEDIRVLVARDVRLTSPELKNALILGLQLAGIEVFDADLITTPLFYFSVAKGDFDAGAIISASHNPKEYNGIKFVGKGAQFIAKDSGLWEIREFYLNDGFPKMPNEIASAKPAIFLNEYIEFLGSKLNIKREIHIGVDSGNGAGAVVFKPLIEKIPNIKTEQINFEIDGGFPARGPNPVLEGALNQLSKLVVQNNLEFGVGLDGDADRIVFVDEKGEMLFGDYIMALLIDYWPYDLSAESIIIPIGTSQIVEETAKKRGAKVVLSPVGTGFIKKAMRDNSAVLAGERSCHFYFGDFFNSDSAALAFINVLNIVSTQNKKFSELIAPYKKYALSGEINFNVENKEEIIRKIKNYFKNPKWYSDLDGITMKFDDFWFNLRASNTEPLLRLVIEAKTQELLDEKIKLFKNLVK